MFSPRIKDQMPQVGRLALQGFYQANLFFLPVSNKFKEIVGREVVRREMLSDIFYSIAQGDSPRIIEERVSNHRI